MKKLLACMAALAMLTGCGETGDDGSKSSRSPKSASEAASVEESSDAENTSESTEESTEDFTEASTEAETVSGFEVETIGKMTYRQALERSYYACIYPHNDENSSVYGVNGDRFAITDIDADGSDELICMHTDDSMAGMFEVIYDHTDAGELYIEYMGFPDLQFYANGVITENISHNQGYSGDFWPYSLSVYDEDIDRYVEVAYVEAMDKALITQHNENSDYTIEYPEYADTSKTGFVYYIHEPDEDGDLKAVADPLDVTEYQEWRRQYIPSESDCMDIRFFDLTEENIAFVDGYSFDEEAAMTYSKYYSNDAKWQAKYSEKLLEACDEAEDFAGFSIYDITGDGLPELIYSSAGFHVSPCEIYTMDNDELKHIGTAGAYGTIVYDNEKNQILVHDMHMGYEYGSNYVIKDGKLEEVFTYYTNRNAVSDTSQEPLTYQINNKEVTAEEFESSLKDNCGSLQTSLGNTEELNAPNALRVSTGDYDLPETSYVQ